MPNYDWSCGDHEFTQYATYDDDTIKCQYCKKQAHRIVLQAPGVIYNSDGFTLRVDVPYPKTDSDKAEQQGELQKALRKRGWDKSRAFAETNKAIVTDEKGQKSLDRSKIPQTVDKHGKEVSK